MAKSIEMNYKESSAYEVIYPQTIAQNVIDLDMYISDSDLLLSDTAKELLEISSDSTPNDAFIKLALGTGKWAYAFYLKTPKGNPISNVAISGIEQINGGSCITDENGYTFGVAETQSITISATSPYADLDNISNQQINSTGIITTTDLTMSDNEQTEFEYSSSRTIVYSSDVETMDFCLVGGGGGGNTGSNNNRVIYWGGGGGNGADTFNELNVINNSSLINVTIGAGGQGTYRSVPDQTMGGTTLLSYSNFSYQALGGGTTYPESRSSLYPSWTNSRQSNNGGLGGDGYFLYRSVIQATVGGDATIYKFNDESLGYAGGGGGGGSGDSSATQKKGGQPYGGTAKWDQNDNGNALGFGGGGGGMRDLNMDDDYVAGNGYQGVVYIRIHK